MTDKDFRELDRKTGGMFPETALDIHEFMTNYFNIPL